MEDDPDELERTCPKCGKVEPVGIEAIEYAREQGMPDVWVCWDCVAALTPARA